MIDALLFVWDCDGLPGRRSVIERLAAIATSAIPPSIIYRDRCVLVGVGFGDWSDGSSGMD